MKDIIFIALIVSAAFTVAYFYEKLRYLFSSPNSALIIVGIVAIGYLIFRIYRNDAELSQPDNN